MAKPKANAVQPEQSNVDLAEKDRKVLFFINRRDYLEALAAQKAATAKDRCGQ